MSSAFQSVDHLLKRCISKKLVFAAARRPGSPLFQIGSEVMDISQAP